MLNFIQLYETVMNDTETYGDKLNSLVDTLRKEGFNYDSDENTVAKRVQERFNLKSSTSHEAGLITAQVMKRLKK